MSKTKRTSEGFIKFYNCFMENTNYKLSPEEWYFYSLLHARWSVFLDCTELSISKLTRVQTIYNDKQASKNYPKVWKQVEVLRDKGVIELDVKEVNGKIDFKEDMKVYFVKLMTDESEKEYGHEQIFKNVYDLSTNPIELYFLCILKRFESSGFSKNMNGLAKLLECDEKTAQKAINAMSKKKLISYEPSKRFQNGSGKFASTSNTYHLYSLKEEVKVVAIQEQKVEQKPKQAENKPKKEFKALTEWGNWGNAGNLDNVDFDLYVANKENSDFMKIAENKINRITRDGSNNNAKYIIDKNIENAEKRAKSKEQAMVQQVKEKKEEEQIKTIKNSNSTFILVDRELQKLNPNDLKMDDTLVWVGEKFVSGGYRQDDLAKQCVRDLISSHSQKLRKETIQEILEHLKKIIKSQPFNADAVKEFKQFRDDLLKQKNDGKSNEEDWEGDIWRGERNQTKFERFRRDNRKRDSKDISHFL
ncbi:hypothetical protein [Saccharibacillus endophyticus]|uniref:DnaD domain-containing protein n=1 Tax=Saccharibacillus endophyticus TaxID=2060666 RepID=A0ABQ1ZXG5_9BACL|nr:hypothetical protein [Saccharibacillus endophyticus]GGH81796.1 hypothetical protein GCM10007362_32140 [Saccharibacillus endophyticus]